ncbi:glycosyltransferase family 4 protein [Aquimarina pacifica]|uniref:glycosyltransferase family 4 protein n=1 Tax=Aquimarina pacifica TaxID=1296415 RepID=UPI00046F919B|nr:glycosyltransferase family 4 protein [Aquimarina pacifica]
MRKLVYITNQVCGPGGLERVLSIKASFLAENLDYEVHILTLNQEDDSLFYDFSTKIKYHNISVGGNPISYFLSYRKGIKSILSKIKPDVVSVCDDGIKGLLLPLLVGKQCPMVYERHVSKNIEAKGDQSGIRGMITKIKFKLMDFGGSFYDKFIVLTNGNLNEWKLKNTMVIPNPLSFFPDAQSTVENKKVLAVGKQSFQKGYDRLLQSWKTVQKKNPDWQLDIYGTINESEGLDQLAKELGVSETVNFYAPVKNIAEKYKEASIYVMSSRYEGFGMVLTEAMAFGVPCVSFDCPFGPSDIISDQENGILVKNDDIQGLADGMIALISDEEKRKAMGQNARESVAYYFPERIASIWDDLFKSITKQAS